MYVCMYVCVCVCENLKKVDDKNDENDIIMGLSYLATTQWNAHQTIRFKAMKSESKSKANFIHSLYWWKWEAVHLVWTLCTRSPKVYAKNFESIKSKKKNGHKLFDCDVTLLSIELIKRDEYIAKRHLSLCWMAGYKHNCHSITIHYVETANSWYSIHRTAKCEWDQWGEQMNETNLIPSQSTLVYSYTVDFFLVVFSTCVTQVTVSFFPSCYCLS